MKKILFVLSLMAVVLSTVLVQADPILYNFSIKFNVSLQGAASTNSANITTYASPHKYSITNTYLLKIIAADEHTLGNYTNNVFPSGSKLVLVNAGTNFDDDYFIVTDKHGTSLTTVSNLISIRELNSNYIQSGKVNKLTGLNTKLNQGFIVEINFDDTKAGGSTAFYVIGLLTAQLNDVVKSDHYVATTSGTISDEVGDGTFNDTSALVTGSASFSSDQDFPLP